MVRQLFSTQGFSDRLRLLTDGYRSVAAAAKALGIKEQTLRNALSGNIEPKATVLADISAGLGVSVDFLLGIEETPSPKIEPPSGIVLVQKLDVHAAAGDGADNSCASVEEELEFPEWMIKALSAARARLRIIRALGDSMEPVIANGALLLVDEKDTDLRRKRRRKNRWDYPEIFVFEHDGETLLKRLRLIEGMVVAESYNPDVDVRAFRLKDILVRARVIWWDNRLK